MTTEDPPCPECGGKTERGYFSTAAIWTRPLAAYGNPALEGFYKQNRDGGHIALEKDADTGAVRKVPIQTPQDQRDYCKRNGLIDPKNLPSNLKVAADGKSYEKQNISEV